MLTATDLGVFRTDAAGRLVGALSLVAALTVYAMALEAVRREAGPQGGDEGRPWWFGYTRDLTNILGLTLVALAHYLLGFAGPLALLAGALTTLALYGLDYACARVLRVGHCTWAVVIATTLLTLPTQLTPRTVAGGLERLIAALVR
jgi:hypothetical protein